MRHDNIYTLAPLLATLLADEADEVLLAVGLSLDGEVLGTRVITRGRQAYVTVSGRHILSAVESLTAQALVLAHNHPSANPEPSDDDVAVVQELRPLALQLGAPILDAVVVTRDQASNGADLAVITDIVPKPGVGRRRVQVQLASVVRREVEALAGR